MSYNLTQIIILTLAMLLSGVVVRYALPRIVLLSLQKGLLDPYDPRKIHSIPTSRLGGVTFFITITIVGLLTIGIINRFEILEINLKQTTLLQVCAVLLMYLVGVLDDIAGMKYRQKFVYQLISATLIVLSGVYISNLGGLFGIEQLSPYIGIPITILLIVFITNAINLIDGIDGLSAMISITAFVIYGALFFMIGSFLNSLVAFITFSVLIPYCYFNVFGIRRRVITRIIMGDSGTLVIGSILSILAIKLWNAPVIGILKPETIQVLAFTVILIPCYDVVRVVLRRYKNKKPLFLPDKNHFHHKLMAMGLNKHKTLIVIITCNIAYIILNILLSTVINFFWIIIIDTVLWTIMHLVITAKIKKI